MKKEGSALLSDRDGMVPAVAKSIDILRYLNRCPGLEAGLHELSTELHITKSHCHGIMKTLLAAGWVDYDEDRRFYTLGPRLLKDVSGLVPQRRITGPMHQELMRLSTLIGIPCVLTRVNRDGSYIAIDKAEGGGEFQVSVPVGYLFPADSTAQFRVRLAWADDETLARELADWAPVRRTPTTILDRHELEREIRLTRERGYAVSRAEYTPGVMTLAAPVFDLFGAIEFILVVPAVEAYLAPQEASAAAALLETARRMTSLGGGGD